MRRWSFASLRQALRIRHPHYSLLPLSGWDQPGSCSCSHAFSNFCHEFWYFEIVSLSVISCFSLGVYFTTEKTINNCDRNVLQYVPCWLWSCTRGSQCLLWWLVNTEVSYDLHIPHVNRWEFLLNQSTFPTDSIFSANPSYMRSQVASRLSPAYFCTSSAEGRWAQGQTCVGFEIAVQRLAQVIFTQIPLIIVVHMASIKLKRRKENPTKIKHW